MQTVGLYTDAQSLLQKPDYFSRLQQAVGLNLVIIGFGGELPAAVLAESPFPNHEATPESVAAVLTRHLDDSLCSNQPDLALGSVGPHVGRGGNDRALRKAIDQAHRLGLKVWFVAGAWTANDYHTLMYCPSHPQVNAWYEALFVHLATQYGVEGVDVTHARYPMLSEPRGLFLCGCQYCALSAHERGYDLKRIKQDIYGSLDALHHLDIARPRAVDSHSLALSDLWQVFGMRSGLFEWLQLRADILTDNLARFHKQIHQATASQVAFGADTYPSSLALWAGHNQARWQEGNDFASPLISHADIFVMKAWVALARFLQNNITGLTEAEALQWVYRLTGYDSQALPHSVADMALESDDCEFRNIPLRELLALDMAKARLTLPPAMPSYPIIQGGGAPHLWPREIIDGVIQDAQRLGHQGVMLQGTASLLGD